MHTAIYLRSSRRDPVALARQQEMLESICREQGWEFQVYRDEVVSDQLEHRPGLARLLRETEQGQVERLLVTSWDRLAKDERMMQQIKERFQQAGVAVLDWYLNSL